MQEFLFQKTHFAMSVRLTEVVVEQVKAEESGETFFRHISLNLWLFFLYIIKEVATDRDRE